MFFFFFKHKTAYEMRISDWSSDVCSSDLSATLAWRGVGWRYCPTVRKSMPAERMSSITWWISMRSSPSPDRKSVVSGKSVSVRVYLGGRRIINKTTYIHQHLILTVPELNNRS